MTGVAQMLAAPKVAESLAESSPETVSEQSFGALNCTVFPVAPGAALACRLMGDPERFGKTPYTTADMTALPLPRGTMAVGLGAFGDSFEDCKPRFGEFLAAGGASVCMLTDGSKMPDYSVARGELVPEVQTLYAAVATGAFSHCVRFETDGETDAPLSQLVHAGLSILRSDAMGMVMIAETAGIIGAALKQSPALPMNQEHLFEHPGVRDWLRFAPEGVYNRTLALVAGLATAKDRPELVPFVRPMGPEAFPAGHFHAAAFSYRALPKGALPLEETLSDLFDEQSLLGLVHLLNDVRPINGAGESQFVRGAMWIGPIASVDRSSGAPRAAL
jgi:hypothetical protein